MYISTVKIGSMTILDLCHVNGQPIVIQQRL